MSKFWYVSRYQTIKKWTGQECYEIVKTRTDGIAQWFIYLTDVVGPKSVGCFVRLKNKSFTKTNNCIMHWLIRKLMMDL